VTSPGPRLLQLLLLSFSLASAQTVGAEAERLLAAGKWAEAKAAFEARIAAGDKPTQARAWSGLAQAYLGMADNARALDAFSRRRELCLEIGDASCAAEAASGMGTVYRRRGETDRAVAEFGRARTEGLALNDPALIAMATGNLAAVTAEQAKYDEALRLYEEAIRHGETLPDKTGVMTNYLRLADLHRFLNHLDEAEEWTAKGLGLADKLNSRLHQGAATNTLGHIYRYRGFNLKALHYYNRSLEVFRALNLTFQVAQVLNDIGYLYLQQHNPKSALDYFAQCRPIFEKFQSKYNLAGVYTRMGLAYYALGQTAAAHAEWDRSMPLLVELKDEDRRSALLRIRGIALAEAGDLTRAREMLEEAVRAIEGQARPDNLSETLARLAVVRLRQNDPAAARLAADRAVTLARESGFATSIELASGAAGKVARREGKQAEAVALYREAIEAVERQRSEVGGATDSMLLFAHAVGPYRELAEIEWQQRRYAGALRASEHAKARALRDLFRAGPDDLDRFLTPAERDRQRKLRDALNELNRKKAPAERLASARRELEMFQASARAAHPELDRRLGSGAAFELAAFRGNALEYLITDSAVYWFLVNGPRVTSGRVAATPREVAKKVAEFREKLAARDPIFRPLAQELGRLLVPETTPIDVPLAIVPDGALWDLPFQALVDGQGRFLIDRNVLSYAPSLGVLREMATRRRALDAKPAPALVAANDAVPGASDQVKRIAGLFRPAAAVFTGPESAFKAQATKHGLLHLETHGFLEPKAPLYSRLQMAGDDRDDGWLEAWEIAALPLQAKLVVLAACETARGQLMAGEGAIGLAWSLFAAGVPTAVVSQWKVDSASTVLFEEFYRALNGPRGPAHVAQSLRRAAQELRKNDAFRHPFYWAGFVVAGDVW
jgi:CHAT domain-containing protein/Tfp pilus assembly protein PilF